jgi:hypothetical protein
MPSIRTAWQTFTYCLPLTRYMLCYAVVWLVVGSCSLTKRTCGIPALGAGHGPHRRACLSSEVVGNVDFDSVCVLAFGSCPQSQVPNAANCVDVLLDVLVGGGLCLASGVGRSGQEVAGVAVRLPTRFGAGESLQSIDIDTVCGRIFCPARINL